MRPRRHGTDYAYGIEHSEQFPEQYRRIEHRFKLADIDWCEFCGYCHKPVMLCEMVRDTEKGIDLNDKATTVIGHLARGVSIPAYAIGVYIRRPAEIQAEIDQLNARILDLTRQWPITRIRAQMRQPHRSKVREYDTGNWWELVAGRHSEHHQACERALASSDRLASPAWLARTQQKHRGLWVPVQPHLFTAGAT
jgi:hypothetical protein